MAVYLQAVPGLEGQGWTVPFGYSGSLLKMKVWLRK